MALSLETLAQKIPPAVTELLKRLHQSGFQAFMVGGSVRDLLRGETPKDFDVATSARPEQVQKLFRKVIPTGIDHGTVTVLSGGLSVEVTTFRSEGKYEDGRRPSEVRFESDLDLDLSRRDFTINAMAFDPVSAMLRDPFDGQRDLLGRCVRTVGQAIDRFSEDGLRPLRAVRFATVLGFEIEPQTEAAISRTLPVFRKVAGERVREELGKILLSPRVGWGVERLGRVGLLAEILPELTHVPGEPGESSLQLLSRVPAEWVLRLTALLLPVAGRLPQADPELGFALADTDAVQRALERLKLPRQVALDVEKLVQLHPAWSQREMEPVTVRRMNARAGLQRAEPLARLLRAIAEAREIPIAPRAWWILLDQIVADPPPLAIDRMALNGAAVMRLLGVKPSPVVGEALRFLLNEVLEDPASNRPDELEQKLKLWASARGL